MGEFIDSKEEFKTPQAAFVQELEALEKYNHTNADAITRMSLFNQFDPLVAAAHNNSSPKVPTIIKIENNSHEPDNEQHVFEQTMTDLNSTGTLIQVATPKATLIENNMNGHIPVNNSPLMNNIDSNHLKHLEEEKCLLETLFGQLLYINEETFNLVRQKLDTIADDYKKEIQSLVLMKSRLEDDINSVEENYYDIHSRYEKLRTVNKGMEAHYKEVIQDLNNKFKEKEEECRKWMLTAESANQRLQSAANNESVSLKAQIKLLEMKVGSLQSQNEQKSKENQELSHLLDELIASSKN